MRNIKDLAELRCDKAPEQVGLDINALWYVAQNKLINQDLLGQVVFINSQEEKAAAAVECTSKKKTEQKHRKTLLTHFILLFNEANKMPGYPGTSHTCVVEI